MIRQFIKKVRIPRRLVLDGIRSLGRQKIFCVGMNKTGTTSLKVALQQMGIVVGNQRQAELMLRDWSKRDFKRLIRYCHTAQAFQDIPFSLPYTFQAVDMHFPSSKFILTVRDNPEQWYQSLVTFHKKVFGEKHIKSLSSLKEVDYCYKGFTYECQVLVRECNEDDPYNKKTLIDHYNYHNNMVRGYFRNRPEDLLILNVAERNAYQKLSDFIKKPFPPCAFPWKNKTDYHN